MTSQDSLSPAQEYVQRRALQRNDAERRIAFDGRAFLLLQLIAGGTYAFGQLTSVSPSWPPDFPTYALLTAIAVFLAASLFSLYFAGRAAIVVFANFDVLETAWCAIGFAPWGILLFQMSLLLLLMLRY